MTHPNELDQQIENLRTLQQSYDGIAQAAEAYNVGKTQLAAAITAKGVETQPTETYPEMADKVTQIIQTQQVIDGGEMYAKQLFGVANNDIVPGYWNLYEIMAQLLSDGRLVSYGGILLAEYYKGYDSLALAGAGSGGAYVVSDKDANGNFIMYTEDTTHVWATEEDGKGNRWVAYCFADAGHDFDIIDTNTSPRSIVIGRNVGVISCLVNTRISQIIVFEGSSLKKFNSNSRAANWGNSVVIRNLINGTDNNIIYNSTTIEKIYIEGENLGGNIFTGPANIEFNLSSIVAKTKIANNLVAAYVGSTNTIFSKIKTIIFADVESGTISAFGESANTPNITLEKLIFIECEGFTHINSFRLSTGPSSWKYIYIGYKNNDRSKSINFTGTGFVEDIELKDGWCKPLNVSVFGSLTEENIVSHILNRLGDNSGQSTLTITLGSTNLAKLTEEEKAIATNKGFTLA